MKLFLLSTILFALSAATAMVWSRVDCIEGSGRVVSENRETTTFHGIKSNGSMDVKLTQGPTTAVRVEAEDNIVPIIVTEVKDGILVIKAKDKTCFDSNKPVIVHVTTPDIASLAINGSGDLVATTKISSKDLALAINGSGSMTLTLDAPKLAMAINGSGDAALSGTAGTTTMAINGSGDIDASELKCDAATVAVAGSGDCKVNAAKTLDVTVAGSGDVLHSGGAKVKSLVRGSGSVRGM